MFKIIEDLIQGSEEWHKRRNSGIGGTDAPVIMGENPWKSSKYLLDEKLGLRKRFEGNEHTRRGINLEPLARSAYEEITKIKLEPAVLQSTKHFWQFASTDGINVQKKKVIEIKCGIKAYEYTAENNKAPPYYYGQIQHILSVSGYESLDFFCWLPDYDPVLVNIERDEEYITRLIREEFKFYELMQSQKQESTKPENSQNLNSQQQATYNSQSYSFPMNPIIELFKDPENFNRESSVSENIKLNENLPKIFLKGASYSGDLKDGLMHGFGTITSKDSRHIYIGDFKNGLIYGFGTLIKRDGNVYTGDWFQDIYVHYDREEILGWRLKCAVWSDIEGNKYSGDLYTSDFEEFKFQGFGTYQWYEGAKYEGFFVDGVREGEGTYTTTNGKQHSGIWKKGVLESALSEYVKSYAQDINSYYKKFINLEKQIYEHETKWADFNPYEALYSESISKSSIFLNWLKSKRKLLMKLDEVLANYDNDFEQLANYDNEFEQFELKIETDFYCCFEDSCLDQIKDLLMKNIERTHILRNLLWGYYLGYSRSNENFDHID